MTTAIKNVYGKKYFVIDSGIAKANYRPGITSMKVKDDKGNEVFGMAIDLDAAQGNVNAFSMTCNGVSDEGNLVALIPIADDVTAENLKVLYGSALVSAKENLEKLSAQMAAEAGAIDTIFAGIQ